MLSRPFPDYHRTARVFDRRAAEYDQWFEKIPALFAIELRALQELRTDLAEPRCEIGVGPGRFAQALAIPLGMDPAFGALGLAARRSIKVCQGAGEALPFRAESLGTIFLLFTLCFLTEPEVVLAQCRETLRPGGHLVLGMIPADSPWGLLLAAKKAQNHPFYRQAIFREAAAVQQWLPEAGFRLEECRSTLRQPPGGELDREEKSSAGLDPQAGFVVLVGRKERR